MTSHLPVSWLLAVVLSGCSFAPLPALRSPPPGAQWHVPEGFKLAEPADHRIPADWWKIYGDADLDMLETQVASANQTQAEADAQYRLALATTAQVRAALYPSVNAAASATRSQQPVQTANGPARQPAGNLFNLSTSVSWEPDLWGATHANILAASASEQAAFANRAAILLSLQATLASDYFQLRIEDATIALLENTVAGYQKSVDLTRQRDAAGVAARSDVTQAISQLESARAQLADARITRDTLEHAIAVLVGQSAADFRLPKRDWSPPSWPALPLELPSSLLERRPDIANAERLVAASAARVTAAEAAFYPVLTLTGSAGFENGSLGRLLSLPSRLWSIGPQLTQFLYDGGSRSAVYRQNVASLDQATATYKETVIEAIQSVEDNLTGVFLLAEEQERQRANEAAARETLKLTNQQYTAGTVGYLNVITAQSTLLTAQSSVLALESRRAAAHIQLVKALGGGWQVPAGASAGSGLPPGTALAGGPVRKD